MLYIIFVLFFIKKKNGKKLIAVWKEQEFSVSLSVNYTLQFPAKNFLEQSKNVHNDNNKIFEMKNFREMKWENRGFVRKWWFPGIFCYCCCSDPLQTVRLCLFSIKTKIWKLSKINFPKKTFPFARISNKPRFPINIDKMKKLLLFWTFRPSVLKKETMTS